jgi:hypothetical protein
METLFMKLLGLFFAALFLSPLAQASFFGTGSSHMGLIGERDQNAAIINCRCAQLVMSNSEVMDPACQNFARNYQNAIMNQGVGTMQVPGQTAPAQHMMQ